MYDANENIDNMINLFFITQLVIFISGYYLKKKKKTLNTCYYSKTNIIGTGGSFWIRYTYITLLAKITGCMDIEPKSRMQSVDNVERVDLMRPCMHNQWAPLSEISGHDFAIGIIVYAAADLLSLCPTAQSEWSGRFSHTIFRNTYSETRR